MFVEVCVGGNPSPGDTVVDSVEVLNDDQIADARKVCAESDEFKYMVSMFLLMAKQYKEKFPTSKIVFNPMLGILKDETYE